MSRNKTTLSDLNEYMFAQLDALSNDDLTTEELEVEINRAKAVTGVAQTIIETSKVVLDAQKHADNFGYGASREDKKLPEMIGGSNETK